MVAVNRLKRSVCYSRRTETRRQEYLLVLFQLGTWTSFTTVHYRLILGSRQVWESGIFEYGGSTIHTSL